MVKAKYTEIPLKPLIGSEIQIDRKTLLSGEVGPALRRTLEERGVLCFRGLNLTAGEQLQFARTLGAVSDERPSGILEIAMNEKLNPSSKVANYQKSSITWHWDGYSREVPFFATMLNPKGLSETGGQTEVSNAYAAYEDLPEDERKFLDTLNVVHNFETTMRTIVPWPTYAELLEWQEFPTTVRPMVWKHKNGRKSLLIGHSASHVEGMDLQKGRALLCRLCEWATQPRYVYTHEWKMGDILIWDNTGTLHRVVPYPHDSARVMLRTTLTGEEPVM
jgi:alpha-ketoglutarate-dependent taurine dioxygenase